MGIMRHFLCVTSMLIVEQYWMPSCAKFETDVPIEIIGMLLNLNNFLSDLRTITSRSCQYFGLVNSLRRLTSLAVAAIGNVYAQVI